MKDKIKDGLIEIMILQKKHEGFDSSYLNRNVIKTMKMPYKKCFLMDIVGKQQVTFQMFKRNLTLKMQQ